jgi:hypothetical protein
MQNLMLNLNLHPKLPGITCEERNSRIKHQKLVILGCPTKKILNYQLKGNIAGPSGGLTQMQNLMLNLNLHPELPGNTCEKRNSLEKTQKRSLQGSPSRISLIIN